MEPPPPQAVPQSAIPRNTSNLAVPATSRPTTGASPTSYGAMTGISFTNGGGFSFEGRNGMPIGSQPGSGSGATPKSYKRNVSGLGGQMDMSPTVWSTSINMEPMSFSSSAQAFGFGSMMSSSLRRSYAAAVSGNQLSSSFASMSFQPQSLGTSYSRRQVHSMLRSDNDIAKDYNCCGIDLPGIHALMEHVEDMHPDGMDDMSKDASGLSTVDNAIAMDMELEDIPEASGSETRSSQSPKPTGPTYAIPPSTSSKPTTPDVEKSAPFSPTSAWLKSEVLVSPANEPPTAKSTQSHSSSSTPPDGSLATPTTSQQPSPVFTPKIATARGFMGTGVGGVTQQSAGFRQQRFERAFNDVVTGKKDNKVPDSVAPGMLFAAGPSRPGIPTVPVAGKNGQPAPPSKESDPPLPAPSLFSPHKPWRCPTPGCNKAYKQSNGLKYHQQKGACDFVIHEAVDLGLSIEEAEERNRPYVCAVGAGCKKRYRQMNGLKYHYLNSGEHGEYGLNMLANQTHPMPKEHTQPPKRPTTSSSHLTNSRPSAAPYHVPSQHSNMNGNKPGMGMPRMGVWPAKPTNGTTGTGSNSNGITNQGPNSKLNPNINKPMGQPAPPRPEVGTGANAVLYTNLGSSDPMDIMARME